MYIEVDGKSHQICLFRMEHLDADDVIDSLVSRDILHRMELKSAYGYFCYCSRKSNIFLLLVQRERQCCVRYPEQSSQLSNKDILNSQVGY